MKLSILELTILRIFLTIITLTIISCDVEEIVVSPDLTLESALEIIPLAVGNSWTMQQHFSKPDTMLRARTNIWFISSVIYEDGVAWYVFTDGTWGLLTRNTAEGFISKWRQEDEPELSLRFPVTAGEKWSDEDKTTEVISTTDVINVKAGLFIDCIHYRRKYNRDGIVYDFWYKPGIGEVKSVGRFYGITEEYHLIEYNLE